MEQAKRMDTEPQSRLVRVRLLSNIASPGGPSGYAGDVLALLEEVALGLIEAGAAVELDDPAPAVEERAETAPGKRAAKPVKVNGEK